MVAVSLFGQQEQCPGAHGFLSFELDASMEVGAWDLEHLFSHCRTENSEEPRPTPQVPRIQRDSHVEQIRGTNVFMTTGLIGEL